MMYLLLSISIIVSYLIGSIPFAYIYGKVFKGIDIRNYGSGNVGATNVLRILGTKAGVIVLLLDIFKGFLPVFIVMNFTNWSLYFPWLPVLVGISSILGHTFTLFLAFKGGKGVASTAGVFLALDPISFIAALFLFIIVVAFSKYVSLGSIFASLFLLVTQYMIFDKSNPYIFYFTLLISLFIIYKHKSNIVRLIKGNENKISFKKKTNGDNN